jgi:NAD(P)-dependent dehydrogenase (short-subunit alcohol dehydrogenase family)
MFAQVALPYGGLDAVAVTAGIFVSPDPAGRIRDDQWAQTFAINVTGLYLVADDAAALWQSQGLAANLVLTTSVNAVVAKTGSLAYDTSKAAANHLVRELAVALAPLVRVNGVAPATVVAGSAMFPRKLGSCPARAAAVGGRAPCTPGPGAAPLGTPIRCDHVGND